MNYSLNGKNIYIPDTEINKSVQILKISKDEAVQMWLEDEGYVTNSTVEELTAKAKINKVNHEARASKPSKTVKKERKPDEEKENIIKIITNCLKDAGFDAEITNTSKIIEFTLGTTHYKLDLIRQRPPKN